MKKAHCIFCVLAITFCFVLQIRSCQEYENEPAHIPVHVTGELLLKLNGINRELAIIRQTTPGGSSQIEEKEIVLHFALQELYQQRYVLNEEVAESEDQSTSPIRPDDAKRGSAFLLQYSIMTGYPGFSSEKAIESDRADRRSVEQRPLERIQDEGSLLDVATMYNYSEIARVLVAHGVSCYETNEQGIMPLLRALDNGHYDFALQLIGASNPWNFRDADGRTLLHILLNARWSRGIRRLIRHADLNFLQISDEYGLTPLHIATFLGDDASVRRLLRRDVPPDAQDNKGRTPLHCAILVKKIKIIRILVLQGAKVDIPDGAGNTPLHYAIKMNAKVIAEFLLEAGADCQKKNKRDFTPVALAGKFGTFALVKLLAQSDTFDRECCVCFEDKQRCVASCSANCSHWICDTCLESMMQHKPRCIRCPTGEAAQKICANCSKNFETVFSQCPYCCDFLQWRCANCSESIEYTPNCPTCQAPLRDQRLYSRYF